MTKPNSITNDEILNAIYDLADDNGMMIGDYIASLQTQSRSAYEGLPEEIITELEEAKQLKHDKRRSQKKDEADQAAKNEIMRFRELFPDTKPEDIPETVWDEVADGTSLTHAYALFLLSEKMSGEYAESVNNDNASRAASKEGDNETEPSFTPEAVEKMSPKDVSRNYKGILRSLSKWKM